MKEKSVPSKPASDLHALLVKSQAGYNKTLSPVKQDRDKRVVNLLAHYIKRLEGLKTEYIRQEDVKGGLAVVKEVDGAKEKYRLVRAMLNLPAQPRSVSLSEWIVLFKSNDPSIWNTKSKSSDSFAMPIEQAPDNLRYLRMSMPSDKKFVIIPLDKEGLVRGASNGERYEWYGRNDRSARGFHLGIIDKDSARHSKYTRKNKKSYIAVRGSVNNTDKTGWGFGHRSFKDDVQGYAWGGKETSKVVFQIDVTSKHLSPTEKRNLLE